MAIIGYEELKERYIAAVNDVDALKENGSKPLPKGITYKLILQRVLEVRKEELVSHMELQCRNEKLRTRNGKLIAIISAVRRGLNGNERKGNKR